MPQCIRDSMSPTGLMVKIVVEREWLMKHQKHTDLPACYANVDGFLAVAT